MSNIVAIVGRPNVGKSTLFNRLVGTRKAIVNEESGVTRDRNYGKSSWNGKDFSVIDTGGYVSNSDDIFEEEINKQVILALDEADVILFMVDAEIGGRLSFSREYDRRYRPPSANHDRRTSQCRKIFYDQCPDRRRTEYRYGHRRNDP